MVLDQLSDQAFDEEYRRRYMRSQSSMTHPFNQDESYQPTLTNNPPARCDSVASTPTWFTTTIPRMQAAGGGGGGGGLEDDDNDDTRGPPRGGPSRGSKPPGPSGPSMTTYPSMAPARMNVIAQKHADFRLATVNAQS